MEEIHKTIKNYITPPPEKTVIETCTDYVKSHPKTVVAGAAVGIIGWCTIPIICSIVGWVPYIGAGYYIYNTSQTAQKTKSWYDWSKKWSGRA